LRRFSSAKKLLISAPGTYDADSPINPQDVDPFDCAQDKSLRTQLRRELIVIRYKFSLILASKTTASPKLDPS
jgi:hypothetical protein